MALEILLALPASVYPVDVVGGRGFVPRPVP